MSDGQPNHLRPPIHGSGETPFQTKATIRGHELEGSVRATCECRSASGWGVAMIATIAPPIPAVKYAAAMATSTGQPGACIAQTSVY